MEDRLREERLAGEEEPELAMPPRESSWLSSYGPALAGLLVLALVTLVWFLRSRRNPEFTVGMEAPVAGSKAGNGVQAPPKHTGGTESDDPEALLDLARAYMAMGKNTQARDCIEAVTRTGTPTQVREARTMLAEL
jgi:FimV-like protein